MGEHSSMRRNDSKFMCKKKKEVGRRVVIMISGGLDKADIDFVKGKVPCLESHPSAVK